MPAGRSQGGVSALGSLPLTPKSDTLPQVSFQENVTPGPATSGETVGVHSYMQQPWGFQFSHKMFLLIKLITGGEMVFEVETL